MIITKEEIKALSNQEKQLLFDMLCESFEEMSDQPYNDPLPDETQEELRLLSERADEYKREPSSAKPWDDVLAALKKNMNRPAVISPKGYKDLEK